MAHHASAKKRARQAEKRRLRNRSNMSAMKTAIKKVIQAIENKKVEEVDELFRQAQSVIARTRRKGTIHRNNMARRISKLAKKVNAFKMSLQNPQA